MWAPPVVEIHQVINDNPFRLQHARVSHSWNPLRFKTSEQTFHRGVMPTVATPTNALGHAIVSQSLPKCPTAILAALVGVKQLTKEAISPPKIVSGMIRPLYSETGPVRHAPSLSLPQVLQFCSEIWLTLFLTLQVCYIQ